MKVNVKRWLFLLHRWFGVGMCSLFALWFATGFIMMYVEYPELTEEERLATLEPLDFSRVVIPIEQAARTSGIAGHLTAISLSNLGARPAYRVHSAGGETAVVYADSGKRFAGHSQESALEVAERSGFVAPGSALRYDARIDMDQWTVSAVLDEHRPLHRVRVGDAAGTVLYLSETTGQVVRDTDERERFWNWLGSTIHWIYPYQLRRHSELWTQLLIYLSVAGIVSVVTGAVVGLLRLRPRNPYRGTDVTPYRGVAKWHHLLGLASLVFLCTFIFSGLMSMSPWGLFDSAAAESEQISRFTGGTIGSLESYPTIAPEAVPRGIKEVEWRQIAGEGHLVLSRSAHDREVMLSGRGPGAAAAQHLRARIEAALPAFVPGAGVVAARVLEDYDDYYYTRHNRYRPLPVYEVRFDDDEATWFYVDAVTGAVVLRYTTAARVQRWLYNGLHSLDFTLLTRRGLAWDATMILLGSLGLCFAVTAVVVGSRRALRVRHRPSLAAQDAAGAALTVNN